MTSRGTEVKFRCDQDCLQCGCPGHTVKASYHHTTDSFRLDFDEGKPDASSEVFDESRLVAMIEAIVRIDWGGGRAKLHPEAAAERARCARIARENMHGVVDCQDNCDCEECRIRREIAAKIETGE